MRKQLIAFGALAVTALATPAGAAELSTSFIRPTRVDPATGLVAGNLPGSGSGGTAYYLALDLAAGDLIAQLQVTGTPNTKKRIDFELLDKDGRVASYFSAQEGLGAKGEATKTFPIDHAGRYVVRIIPDGKESGTYCVLMGGSALPGANAPGCPAPAATAAVAPPPAVTVAPPPAPPPPQWRRVEAPVEPPKAVAKPVEKQPVEVVVSKCEERLRVGSDFLFDFDRAALRPEAEPALVVLADRVAQARNAVMIEGHTDGKGTESYNQGLSERRALSVRTALIDRGLPVERLNVRGFGKSRPV
ncbi:MAG: OmpA family protein, partial [Alphaproteobacteria bacterium]|nr:OmpA family protein [Alphaproteobacteria bacterium]